jgi:predicted amidohydrolase
MRIAVAQIKAIKGNIEANIIRHEYMVNLAVRHQSDFIFFPEPSITGYEPTLARDLATDISDSRLDVFQKNSNENNITIAIGMPVKANNGILISMIIFQPHQPRQAYSKQHLHSDELPFFINGNKQVLINHTIAPGICYETSLPEHWENVHQQGAGIYIASVAKTAAGIERSELIFSEMSKKYSMIVMLSNCVGPADNFISAGKSAVWNKEGKKVAELSGVNEGVLIYDTTTGKARRLFCGKHFNYKTGFNQS